MINLQRVYAKNFKIVKDICEAFGAEVEITIMQVTLLLLMKRSAKFALETAKEIAGKQASERQEPMMGQKIFHIFTRKPGAYAWIGNGNSDHLIIHHMILMMKFYLGLLFYLELQKVL